MLIQILLLQASVASVAHRFGGAGPPVYDGVIRDEGDGLHAAYMVPAGNDNHAATIEQLPDGSLASAWFAGEVEEASGCAIVVSLLAKGSSSWTNSTTVAKRDKYSNQNPLLFFDDTTGTLHLWHTQAPADSGEGEAEVHHLSSRDGGKTWSASERYFHDKGIFIRNRIIRRKDKTLFWPFYSTSQAEGDCPVFAWSSTASVPDNGTGWHSKLLDQGAAQLEQPTCWHQPHDTGTVECYFRDCNQKNIYASSSNDGGKSFSKPEPTKLPNPGSGIEAFGPLHSTEDIVLMFNPTTDEHRDPLAAALSSDGGKTWSRQRNVQNGPTGIPNTGPNEFSYPTVLQTGDGAIHVMYSYAPHGATRTIKYVRFTEDWVKNSTASN